jgi:hypothetical protein
VALAEKISTIAAYIMQVFIALFIIITAYTGDYLNSFGGGVALIITFVPLFMKRKWHITLPWSLNFLIVLSLYMHILGQFGIYHLYPGYDKISHFMGSVTVSLLGFSSVVIMDRFSKIKPDKKQILFFIIIFTLAIGALWEIGEFSLDKIMKTNAQHGLDDTMFDLIADMLGAMFIAGIIAVKFETMQKSLVSKIYYSIKRNLRK